MATTLQLVKNLPVRC